MEHSRVMIECEVVGLYHAMAHHIAGSVHGFMTTMCEIDGTKAQIAYILLPTGIHAVPTLVGMSRTELAARIVTDDLERI